MGESPAPLHARIPSGGTRDADEILDRFLGWVEELGLEPYPHQEEALLELASERHVVLSTPTGSGKSLVAEFLHFKALCEGQRSFYTAPVKALASEKFFSLCRDFGPENVGMLTGDASINRDAPIVCCTAEVLSNMAVRQGEATPAPHVVMDEFHYYADRERGAAWQIPLIALRRTRFLLMSATLGNTAPIEERLHARSGREVAHVHSDERPVPLDFEYRETPLHETVGDLVARGKAPVYVVHFTQRECGERAQGLTSAKLCDPEQRRRIAEAIGRFRFDTAYGKDLRRFLGHGVGVHHAGLLPRYRLLVERLAQQGLLRVICGTDTLGVGVNVPIRTVAFSSLSKFDGEQVRILSVRDFKQIAGRAGRRGFDERGSVVCQAPESAIERRRRAERGRPAPSRARRPRARRTASWNRETFERLIERPPETLESCFAVSHGMLVGALQREDVDRERAGGYRALLDLVDHCHEGDAARARHRRRAAALFRSLRCADVVRVVRRPGAGALISLRDDLQAEFSLHHTLSLYLMEAVAALDPEAPAYAMEVVSLVESILEDPQPILAAQREKLRRELLARLKAEGVPYEERIEKLDAVTHPQPETEFIHESFRSFSAAHPWVGEEDIRPKAIAREMAEAYRGFHDYVREYGLARSEGLLLRYLSQVHNALVRGVPSAARSDELIDVIAYLRATLQRVDSSLVEAWADLLEPEARAAPVEPRRELDLAAAPRLLAARVRAELHALVRALAAGDWEAAPDCVRQDPDDPWDAARFESALAPFRAEYGPIVFTPEARRAHRTLLKPTAPRRWDVFQVLLDPAGDGLWAVEGEVDLRRERDPEGPLVRVRRIGA